MANVDLTTAARVEALLDIGTPTANQTAVVGQIITQVSRAAESYIGRHIYEESRTEYYDVESRQRSLALRGFGEGSLAVTTIHNDPEWDYGTADLVDSEDYTVDERTGIVHFKYTLTPGPMAIKAVYVGGLGTSPEDMITNGYDDLVGAAETQAVFMFKRRADPEVAGVSDPGGNVSFNAQIKWLPWVKEVLDSYRCVGAL